MDLQTLEMGNILLAKYRLCEKVMEYLSDEESVKGQKYLETLKQFVDAFKMEFMTFVHERMEAVGMQFEDLHCPEHSESEAPIEPPTEGKEPKFPIGSKVEIIEGIGKGGIGVVKDYNPTEDRYYVVSDNFYMWFAESDLKAYVEESEEKPEEPPITDANGFSVGDRVKVVLSTDQNYERIGTVEDVEQEFIVVVLDGEEYADRLWFYPEDLELYTDPENPEENGGTDTPDEGE